MKKLLIIGASQYQHYIYSAARELGLEIISVDKNPIAPMFKHSDKYKVIDIFDVERIVEFANKERVDAVASINIDQGMLSVVKVQEKLGFEHKSYTEILSTTRKDRMRDIWAENNISNPEYKVFSGMEKSRIFDFIMDSNKEWIIKPTDNSAKRGIHKINKEKINKVWFQINDAIHNAKNNLVIIEEFIEGDLYFAPTYIHKNGEVNISLIKQHYNENFVQLRFDAPVTLDHDVIELIKNEAVNAVKCFGPGPYHTEIILSNLDKKPYIIETSPRISYSTIALSNIVEGFDPVLALLSEALHDSKLINYKSIKKANFASLVHLQPKPGTIFNGLDGNLKINQESIHEVCPVIKPGHVVQEMNTNVDRVLYFVITGNDTNKINEEVKKIELELNKLFS